MQEREKQRTQLCLGHDASRAEANDMITNFYPDVTHKNTHTPSTTHVNACGQTAGLWTEPAVFGSHEQKANDFWKYVTRMFAYNITHLFKTIGGASCFYVCLSQSTAQK